MKKSAVCGKCCVPGDDAKAEKIIHWYIENENSNALQAMGANGRSIYIVSFSAG